MRCPTCGRIESHCEHCHAANEYVNTRPTREVVVSARSLADQRRTLGITQRRLGFWLDVSEAVISNWENGRNLPNVEQQYEWQGVLDSWA